MSDILQVAFHEVSVRLLDADLSILNRVYWEDQLQFSLTDIQRHSIARNHKDWEVKGFIVTFEFLPEEMD